MMEIETFTCSKCGHGGTWTGNEKCPRCGEIILMPSKKEQVEAKLKAQILEYKDGMVEEFLNKNPGIVRSINRMGIKQGIVLSMLLSGIFSLVNAATIYFNLTYEGWLIAGLFMSSIGSAMTLRTYFQGPKKWHTRGSPT